MLDSYYTVTAHRGRVSENIGDSGINKLDEDGSAAAVHAYQPMNKNSINFFATRTDRPAQGGIAGAVSWLFP